MEKLGQEGPVLVLIWFDGGAPCEPLSTRCVRIVATGGSGRDSLFVVTGAARSPRVRFSTMGGKHL